jgi:hypothetical protein
MKGFSAISVSVASCVVALLAGVPARADMLPPTVTFTVSGSSGDWTLDFSVTNNTDQNLYLFAVQLPTSDITAFPTGWTGADGTVTSPVGPATYDDSWSTTEAVSILPGGTLSGFDALDTAASAPTSVPWIAATCDNTFFAECGGSPYTGPGNELTPDNAVFESAVPEPGSIFLLLTAIACVGLRFRRNASQPIR